MRSSEERIRFLGKGIGRLWLKVKRMHNLKECSIIVFAKRESLVMQKVFASKKESSLMTIENGFKMVQKGRTYLLS